MLPLISCGEAHWWQKARVVQVKIGKESISGIGKQGGLSTAVAVTGEARVKRSCGLNNSSILDKCHLTTNRGYSR